MWLSDPFCEREGRPPSIVSLLRVDSMQALPTISRLSLLVLDSVYTRQTAIPVRAGRRCYPTVLGLAGSSSRRVWQTHPSARLPCRPRYPSSGPLPFQHQPVLMAKIWYIPSGTAQDDSLQRQPSPFADLRRLSVDCEQLSVGLQLPLLNAQPPAVAGHTVPGALVFLW